MMARNDGLESKLDEIMSRLNDLNQQKQKEQDQKDLTSKIVDLSNQINRIKGDIESIEDKMQKVQLESVDKMHKEQLESVDKMHKEIAMLKVYVDSMADNLKEMVKMYNSYYNENFKTLFGDRYVEQVRNQMRVEIKDEAKAMVADIQDEIIFDKMSNFLTTQVRKAVIANGGTEIKEDALSAIVDKIVKNILPQILLDVGQLGDGNGIDDGYDDGYKPPIVAPFDPKELTHYAFGKMEDCVQVGLVPMLVGPAGAGKSTAVEQLSRKLGLPYYMVNRVENAYELTGYKNAEGKYVPTSFYQAYKHGGVFFFDEIDGSNPEALVTVNTAIAQGYMEFPCGLVKMNENFKLVAAGNTFGTGPDSQYCGRNKLDSATLDRFAVIEWDYDKDIEKKIIKDDELLRFAWGLRKVIEKNHLPIIISTRGIVATSKLLDSKNFDLPENIRANLLENVKIDTLNTIKGGLREICGIDEGKYVDALNEIIIRENERNQQRSSMGNRRY